MSLLPLANSHQGCHHTTVHPKRTALHFGFSSRKKILFFLTNAHSLNMEPFLRLFSEKVNQVYTYHQLAWVTCDWFFIWSYERAHLTLFTFTTGLIVDTALIPPITFSVLHNIYIIYCYNFYSHHTERHNEMRCAGSSSTRHAHLQKSGEVCRSEFLTGQQQKRHDSAWPSDLPPVKNADTVGIQQDCFGIYLFFLLQKVHDSWFAVLQIFSRRPLTK